MILSIIIITWNSLELLQDCISSLDVVRQSEDVEILLVDNGSKDDSVSFINQHYPSIKIIELGENKGVAYARNRGIEKSSGEYLLLLDNDTIANEQAIEGMLQFMKNYSDVGVCGCKLMDNNQVQESYKCYPGIIVKIRNLLNCKSKYSVLETAQTNAEVIEPVYLIGACQMISRELINEIGLLDEKIFYGPEDADFCLRARNAGWRVCYLPQYSIIHHWQRATNKKIFSLLAYKHVHALFYFYWKYKRLF